MTTDMRAERGLGQGYRFSAPQGAETEGLVEFPRGAARIRIGGARIPELFRANFWGPPPAVSVEQARVTVRYPRFSAPHWLSPWERRGGEIDLAEDVAWEVRAGGGVAHLVADLTFDGQEFGAVGGRLSLQSTSADGSENGYDFEISGGAARFRITEQEPSERTERK